MKVCGVCTPNVELIGAYLFQFTQLSQYSNMGFSLAFNIGFAMAFVSSFYVLFYVRERVTNSKHLQFVSGVDVSSFWSVSFLCDLVTFIITSLCLLITLVAFQENGFNTAADLGIPFSEEEQLEVLIAFNYFRTYVFAAFTVWILDAAVAIYFILPLQRTFNRLYEDVPF